MCSLHGLIRGENMELGRDSDTGGQVISDIFIQSFLFYVIFMIMWLFFLRSTPGVLNHPVHVVKH